MKHTSTSSEPGTRVRVAREGEATVALPPEGATRAPVTDVPPETPFWTEEILKRRK